MNWPKWGNFGTYTEFTFICPSNFSEFPTALQGCRERAVAAAALLYFALVKLRCQSSHPPATSDPTTRLTRSNMPERSPLNHWRKRKWFDLIWFCHCCVPSLLLFLLKVSNSRRWTHGGPSSILATYRFSKMHLNFSFLWKEIIIETEIKADLFSLSTKVMIFHLI